MKLVKFSVAVALRAGTTREAAQAALEALLSEGNAAWFGAEVDAGRNALECANCGVAFIARRKDAIYCTPSCRQQAHLKKNAAECDKAPPRVPR